jgi:ADP-ribose pyrophosphatase YjhB (NUDIX family)
MSEDDSWRDIRPVALAVVTRDGDDGEELLVFEYRDEAAEETFYRPPGGGVQFGEAASDTAEREFREELGLEATATERLAVLENRFEFEGTAGHEYDLVYAVEPADDGLYEREELVGVETDGSEYRVTWEPLTGFRGDDAPPLYPDGLHDVLE